MNYTDYFANVNDSKTADPTAAFGPQRDSLFIVIPITILYALIFVIGLIGNVFTCLVIVRNKNMHTATNYYLFSLAISDLLLLVTGMPQEVYSIWSKWPYVFGHSFCLIRALASETSTNASVLTITLFTIERYLAICHPFLSHKMSKLSRAIRHVTMLWAAAFILALPLALQAGVRYPSGVAMCLQTRVIMEHSFEISTFVFFFAPMILITVLYALIGLRLNETSADKEKQEEKLFQQSQRMNGKMRRKPSQSTRRVVKMLVAVVVAFFICWAPFHAQRLVAIYGTTEEHLPKSLILLKLYYYLTYISGVFYYVSTCINPIFYHIMSHKFRDAFKVTISQMCCRKTRALPKRYSYSAVAVNRNPTPLNSGSSHSRHKGESAQNQVEDDVADTGTRTFAVPCSKYNTTTTSPTTNNSVRSHRGSTLPTIEIQDEDPQSKNNDVQFISERHKMAPLECPRRNSFTDIIRNIAEDLKRHSD